MSDYPTCAETYATLCVYHDAADPQIVTATLGITPSGSWRRGESHGTRQDVTFPQSGWLFSLKGAVTSRDSLRHIEWLLTAIEPQRSSLPELRQQGYRMNISCYWVSKNGHGGPTLTPDIMHRMAELQLTVEFDVYFSSEDEVTNSE